MNHPYEFHLELSRMMDGLEDSIFVMKADGRELTYFYVNQAATRMTGITMADAGKTIYERYSGPMADYLYKKYSNVLTERTPIRYEDGIVMPNGMMSGESVLSPIFGEHGEVDYVISVTRDITARKNYENLLFDYAYHDDLTKLYNRRFLLEKMKGTEALFLFDLDYFKNINDTFGHDAGDAVLVEVAARLNGAFHEAYTLVRLGGDEFIVASDVSMPQPEQLAMRIMDVFQAPFAINGQQIKLNSSIGIALKQDQEDIPTLLKQADIALYRAKGAGRKSFHVYEANFKYDHVENFIHELALVRAIEEEEFELHYQLIYSPQQEKVIGAEALLRWKRADAGMIQPCQFIPVAEETGLIVPIGYWVLRKACQDWHRLKSRYDEGIQVAVNISSVQLSEPDFVERILEIMKEERVPPHAVELELTESTVIHDSQGVRQTLGLLRSAGFSIALDDFGTGYSSLSMLTLLPIDTLKIDRSFIANMNESLLSAMLVMAGALNLKVIAEGVEDAEQYHMLKALDCWGIQGYYINKPAAQDALQPVPV
ncbi:putative bifunctional diguanylate cyclase/phosphodiesterase [Paenibacillus montanisoli]|uniref:GGDEF-domain containing protein n=1 Tax=Paenibacillus montanisoli TaxID=2081970 RepID=A0A328TVD4_9BACL|nr:GGDEF domain-containing phosphodiesterase [Paenibacillus montanisoli]RAP73582.1 GGDEF-domain containing protein [Paenibacillus montanisoli]